MDSLVKKSFNDILSRVVFSLFFVYVLILGLFNVLIAFNRDTLEYILADLLEVDKVTIGNISNLPLVFISGSELSVDVNPYLSFKIEGFYLHYRFTELIAGDWERVLRKVQIEKIEFDGHTTDIKEYISVLQKKYPTDPDVAVGIDFNRFDAILELNHLSVQINSMQQFWHRLDLFGTDIALEQGKLSWTSTINQESVWSNSVLLSSINGHTKGDLVYDPVSNQIILGIITNDIRSLNLGGIPLIQSNLIVHVGITNDTPSIHINDLYQTNNIVFDISNKTFSLKRAFTIDYEEYEEYKLLDYVFKPGLWKIDLSITRKPDWRVRTIFSSPRYPNIGLNLTLDSITQDKLYRVLLDLKTHYFGGISADLLLPIRKNLYPLPSGSVQLDNTRFVLNGLVFSGSGVVDAIPNKNEMDLSVFDVELNGGLIGNASAKFIFTPDKYFLIKPLPLIGSAVDIEAAIGGGKVRVDLTALNVNGDFLAENIKIPIFGIKDSWYRGKIAMRKDHLRKPFFLDGYLKGFLDEEEQVDVIISLEDNIIDITRAYFVSQNILLQGAVEIESLRSNMLVTIEAQGSIFDNGEIPVNLVIDVQKNNVFVTGTADGVIPINVRTTKGITDFRMDFTHYPMKKLGFPGIMDAHLVMNFDEKGITRFSIQEGTWLIEDRALVVDFDSSIDEENRLLTTSYMRLGLDRDILDTYGYFSFLNGGFSGSFRFDRGGSLQFTMGRYIVKSRLNFQNLIVNNIFEFNIFDTFRTLRTVETETVLADADISIEGPWSDLSYSGSIDLEAQDFDTFRLSAPMFTLSNKVASVTNFRLRHPGMNVDIDAFLAYDTNYVESKISGAFALNNFVKTDFTFDYQWDSNQGMLGYHIPNLYFLSKKPIDLKGKVQLQDNHYVFQSSQTDQGLTGSYTTTPEYNLWNMSFMTEGMRIDSEGRLSEAEVDATLGANVDLNKLKLSGDVRKIKGDMHLDATITGDIENPDINAFLATKNVDLALRSLRNRIIISNEQAIYISNNQLTIPKIAISTTRGGDFELDGGLSIHDQTLGETDIRLYSKDQTDLSYLDWNLDVPFLSVKGKTYISNINLSGTLEDLTLSAYIRTDNINLGLELDDIVGDIGTTETGNPLLATLSFLNLDINIDMENRSRFLNQLFDLEFKQQEPISIKGSIGNNDLQLTGNLEVEKGNIAYLNSDLKVVEGFLQFSGEKGDFAPSLSVNTETTRNTSTELIDVYVNFEGKLPNLELAQITSNPPKPRLDLLNIIGFGGSAGLQAQGVGDTPSSRDIIASGVGVAENALFTAPLSRRIQKIVPFIDTFQIKTDVLGNLTRSANSGTGTVSGLSILHGSEIEVGQFLPNIPGLQLKYNLRLESPENTSVDTGNLNQIHKAGVEWSRLLPYGVQLGIGANVLGEVKPNAQQPTEPEFQGDFSIKKRF